MLLQIEPRIEPDKNKLVCFHNGLPLLVSRLERIHIPNFLFLLTVAQFRFGMFKHKQQNVLHWHWT